MRLLVLIFTSVWLAGAAAAQDYAVRDGDVALGQGALARALIGQDIVFYDNGRAEFGADGGYIYTYDGSGSARGRYVFGSAGEVCITFDNGWKRCDRYVRDGARLVVLTQKGERFPVRP